MGIRSYRPTNNGRRDSDVADFKEITKHTPEKSLLAPWHQSGGRNFAGHVTVRFRGGGHKRMYRLIDWKRDKDDVPARVAAIEYDPNRTPRIALLHYVDGEKRYILAPKDLEVGQTLLSGEKVEPSVGNCMPLENIPLGTVVHAVELSPGRGAQLARSAGVGAELRAIEGKYAHLVMPSGEVRLVHRRCRGTVGIIGNEDYQNIRLGKAGRKRWKGRRPHVRGVAMNPVDHPLGGGDGKGSTGRDPCGPTGVLSKGGKTRRPRNPTNRYIVQRAKKRKKGR